MKNEFEYYKSFLKDNNKTNTNNINNNNNTNINSLFDYLVKNIDWEQREIKIFGKVHMQPRLIKWFGDMDYVYSKTLFKKNTMPKQILDLKEKIEKFTGVKYNSVLLNYYRDGNDSMGKHSDNEKELGLNPNIASISLGGTRELIITSKFDKTKKILSLENGSLLVMKGDSQKLYTHQINKTKKEVKPRVNLTFRYIC